VLDLYSLRPNGYCRDFDCARETGRSRLRRRTSPYGGMGSNVARIVSGEYPVPMRFVDWLMCIFESGDPDDLLEKYHLTSDDICMQFEKY